MRRFDGFGGSKRLSFALVAFLVIFVSAINANAAYVIFDSSNYNIANQPPDFSPSFIIATNTYITAIWDYHYNNGRGAGPGTIGLEKTSGTPSLIGTWNAVTDIGQPPISWWVHPNVLLAPGTYNIVDSHFYGWSTSWDSGGYGHAADWAPGIAMSQVWAGTAPVPIPGAVWLLGPGLVGLAAARRRFKN
jgi:hypothetical protein